jgi:endo-1,4-beta-D-glucanase Y
MRLFVVVVTLLLAHAVAWGAPPAIGGSLNAPAFWQAFKARFISPAGRVVDNANKNISHSEGQGYGMLLAVAANDRATFDLLWQWSQTQLGRDDGLFAWKWDPNSTPHVVDANDASDGDLLIAWALAEAGEHWPGSPYTTASAEIARAISKTLVIDSDFGPVLIPGSVGFDAGSRRDAPVVNLSYWVFPAFWRLQYIAPEGPWAALAKSGAALVSSARFGASGLPSDWISIHGAPRPADGYATTFGFDAVRIPLYFLWGGMGTKARLAPYAALWTDQTSPPRRIDVLSNEALDPMASKGYLAIAALVRCADSGAKLPTDLTGADVDFYYPTTLRALTLIAARQRFPECL